MATILAWTVISIIEEMLSVDEILMVFNGQNHHLLWPNLILRQTTS